MFLRIMRTEIQEENFDKIDYWIRAFYFCWRLERSMDPRLYVPSSDLSV